MTTKENGPLSAPTGKGPATESFDSSYSVTTEAEKPDIETRLAEALDGGLVNDDGRHVDDNHFAWGEPPEGFEFSDDSVYAISTNRYGETYSVKIAGRLWVSAHKAGQDGGLFIEVSFMDNDGKTRRVDIPRGNLTYPDRVVQKLLQEGASVDPMQARHVARYLANSNPVTRLEKNETQKPKVETVKTLCFADVAPEKISWLWFGKIALGKLTLLVGDPGLGKSLITLFMAARLSLGGNWPDGSPCPTGNTIFISCEDDPGDTIRPRLDAAEADVKRVHLLTAVCNADGKERTFTLDNIPALEEAIVRLRPSLIAIDPISAYMGGADSHNNADVRGVLAPLSALASKYKVAIVAVSHLNKGYGQAVYRTMGSLAFTAAARAVWGVVKDKADPDRRLLLPIKNNIGNDTSGFAYKVTTAANGAPCLEWESMPVTDYNLHEAFNTAIITENKGSTGSPELDDAKVFLGDLLHEKPLPVSEIKKQASDAGFSFGTLRRAKNSIGILSVKDGFGGGWVWKLPEGGGTYVDYAAILDPKAEVVI